MLRRVVWYKLTFVSEVLIASIMMAMIARMMEGTRIVMFAYIPNLLHVI
jgi:hypothetical protein